MAERRQVPARARGRAGAVTDVRRGETDAGGPELLTSGTSVETLAVVTGSEPVRVTAADFAVREQESPWTEQEVQAVRAELLVDMQRLEQDVVLLETGLADVTRHSLDGAGDDHADTGSKAYDREQELGFLTTTRATLFQTRHALGRIEDGTYGDCELCGRPIGKLRLQAFPRAVLCVACKQRQERR